MDPARSEYDFSAREWNAWNDDPAANLVFDVKWWREKGIRDALVLMRFCWGAVSSVCVCVCVYVCMYTELVLMRF